MLDTTENRRAFSEAIQAAYLTVGQPAPSKPMVRMFWQVLNGYEIEEIESAVARHLANPDNGQFAPKPADLIRLIEGDTRTKVALAWGKVENSIRRVGPYDSLVFDDALIHAVISDMGGWADLCNVTEDELPFRARDFENRYRAYCQHPPVTFPRVVAGISEAHAISNSLPAPMPRLVGDKAKAKQVYALGGSTGTLQISGPKSMASIVQQASARLIGREGTSGDDGDADRSEERPT